MKIRKTLAKIRRERRDALDRLSKAAMEAGLYDRNEFPEGGQDESCPGWKTEFLEALCEASVQMNENKAIKS